MTRSTRDIAITLPAEALDRARVDALAQGATTDPTVVYAWVLTDPKTGAQAFIVMPQPGGRAIVMADIDKRRLLAWRPAIEGMAEAMKAPISLVRYVVAETLETIG